MVTSAKGREVGLWSYRDECMLSVSYKHCFLTSLGIDRFLGQDLVDETHCPCYAGGDYSRLASL